MADIDAIERLLCQRYNVAALDAGELSGSLALARAGDDSTLRRLLGERELYRWRSPIFDALGEPAAVAVAEPQPEPEEEVTSEPEPEEAFEEPEPEARPQRTRRRGRR